MIPDDPADVVEYSRMVGRTLYDSYSKAPKDGAWSFRADGTIEDHVYKVEITPDGDIFGRHGDLKRYIKAAELSGQRAEGIPNFESHHLIPAEILEQIGIAKEDGIAVAVDSIGHMQDIHGHGGLENGLIFTDIDQLKNYYKEFYISLGAPEWADKVDEYVEANRDTFTEGLAAIADQLEAGQPDPLAEPAIDEVQDASDALEASGDAVNDVGADKV